MAKPQSKKPIVFALIGAALLALVVVMAMKRGSPHAPAAAPNAAAIATPSPTASEPMTAPARRKPKLQVTQLSEAQAAKPTEMNAPTTSAGSGSAVASAVKSPGPAGVAERAPSKTGTNSIASLFESTGIFGTWVAERLGDEFLVTNFGPTATLQITSTPSGASVTYENAVIGVTPLSIKVDRGSYEIVIDLALEGRVDRSVDVWAMFDGVTHVNMPVPVALKLLSKPIGAEVEANGEVIGKTPLEIKVAPDEVQAFTLRLENYEDKVAEISIAKAGTETVVLEHKLQQIVHEFDSVPPGAEVLLEGVVIGKTPMKTDFLEERGATRLYVLRLPDQQRYKDTPLRVPADKPLKRVVKLRDICATRVAEEDTGRPTLVNPYDPCRGVK